MKPIISILCDVGRASVLASRCWLGVAPLSIRAGATTLPGVLKQAGYATGIVAKWHLGLGTETDRQDWNGEIKPGPLEIGFTVSFIIPATGDRVPCVFIENHRIVGLDPNDPIAVSYGQRIGNEPTGADGGARKGARQKRNPASGASEDADLPGGQLFNLATDLGESQNGAKSHPDIVKQLAAQLEKARNANQTRP